MPEIQALILPARGLLAITGEQAKSFLQGLVSNDTSRLSPTQSLYSALLTPQGKYLFDFFLHERDGAVLLETDAQRLDELARRLMMYKLRTPVEIAPLDPVPAVMVLFGAAALRMAELPALPGQTRAAGELLLAVDPRLPELGVRVIGPRVAAGALAHQYGAVQAEFADYDRHRLALGVPDGARDLVLQQSILLESNFEELHGVAFDKGCFVGQELTARTKYRGLVKKRLVPVTLDGGSPAPGDIVRLGAEGREAGELRSINGDMGMALLRLEHLAADELLAGETRVRPAVPAWMKL